MERHDEKNARRNNNENQLQINLSNQVKMWRDNKLNERNEIKKKILEDDLLNSKNVLKIMEIIGTVSRCVSNVGKNIFFWLYTGSGSKSEDW